jgi:cephalosporin-C deacetylase-like acetyl esterase
MTHTADRAPLGEGTVAVLDVAFDGFDGTALRGWLHLPAGATADAPVPGVVVSHGFSATCEMGLGGYADAFAAAGLAVLRYDHRSIGRSDGEPRRVVDPWAQMFDAREALTWLGDRPEVDADRLALWGSSFSGGQAICVGAVDRRVKAVVASVPFAGLGDAATLDDDQVEERVAAITAALDADAPPHADLAPEGPVVREPGSDVPGFLDQPEAAEWFLATGPGTGWENRFQLRWSREVSFDPAVCAMRLAPTPLLMVVAADDRVAPAAVALDTFERAAEPKQLELLDGHHFCAYDGPAHTRAVAVTTDFLVRHLAGPTAGTASGG